MSYFDNNATTPVHPSVIEALSRCCKEDWRNPSSPYRLASRTKAKLSYAREQWSELLKVNPADVIFSSGATESNNWILASYAQNSPADATILISTSEHSSVSEPANFWFKNRVEEIPNQTDGIVCIDSLIRRLEESRRPALVCMIAASNESGIVQPWEKVAKLCQERNVPFHCDTTQWVGKLPLSDLHHCSSFTASAHKFGGPRGVGWLVDQNSTRLQFGGGQEGGRRAGTENFPSIQAMAIAWEYCLSKSDDLEARSIWRDQMEMDLLDRIPGTKVIGGGNRRLWNTSFLLMPEFQNLDWVTGLEKIGFEVSTGSACSVFSDGSSPTARTHSLNPMEVKRLVRVSSYLDHTQEDWRELGDAFVQCHEKLLSNSKDSSVISL